MGIPGFGDARTFVLLDHRPGSIFRWLQSLSIPSLAFVVVDPLIVNESYPIESVRRGLAFLDLNEDEDLIVLGICTVPGNSEPPTVNMMAPIGIGIDSRRGAQVVLHDTSFGSRTEFLKPAS